MAYEVTATRKRPKTFDELAGQEFVAATLKSSLETGRIAHAYLFTGPRGCGKTSSARILARSLNCVKGPVTAPCGECVSCREIAEGRSLDVIEIDGASNTGVNDARQIIEEVLFPPNSSRYKIYIIDEVHMLSNSAFNALLKTIEEPPPYVVFIFATTELHKVPATIKSRCQQFAFRLIPIETIAGILKKTCEEMRIEAEDEALFWIARESTGSLRDAYTLFDQVVSFSDGRIRSAVIREKLGLVGIDNLNALATACVENDRRKALLLIDDLLNAGIAIEQFVIDMAGFYHSLLLLKAGVRKESLLSDSPDRFSEKALQTLNAEQIERALDLLLGLYRDIRYSISPRFDLEVVVSKLCLLDKWVSPLELRFAIASARELLSPSGEQKKNRFPASAVSPAAASPGAIPDHNGANVGAGIAKQSPSETLSEGFKRYLANRETGAGDAPARKISPQAERVLRIFEGTIVN
ncbi:MAG: DNA polymerase III subunit gamma/tau [Treponema sp.]|jgi:DNA polymerase-3 subunit gamma/tau|nr:DNA polymerase III subunit gamma/tau [Treponema sp.]